MRSGVGRRTGGTIQNTSFVARHLDRPVAVLEFGGPGGLAPQRPQESSTPKGAL